MPAPTIELDSDIVSELDEMRELRRRFICATCINDGSDRKTPAELIYLALQEYNREFRDFLDEDFPEVELVELPTA